MSKIDSNTSYYHAICAKRDVLIYRDIQSFTLHPLADLFNPMPSRLLSEAYSHYLFTYPPLSVARYSFISLSELEQCRVNEIVETASKWQQEDSNTDSLDCESDVLITMPPSPRVVCRANHRVLVSMSPVSTQQLRSCCHFDPQQFSHQPSLFHNR